MAKTAKKSTPTTVAKKSYGASVKTPPAASGKGMDPCAEVDHAAMTKPGTQPGKYPNAAN
jgi:hypothetical protein